MHNLENASHPKLLIVWVYYPAVGHLVEALQVAANYQAANFNQEVHVLLNQDTPYDIANYCPLISKVHVINIHENFQEDKGISNLYSYEFDYVVFPKRLFYTPGDYTEELLKCNRFLQDRLKGSNWTGYNEVPTDDPAAIFADPFSAFTLEVPAEKQTFKPDFSGSYPKIVVMLKGASAQRIWPSFQSWKTILVRIKRHFPDTIFFITGIFSIHSQKGKNKKQIKNEISSFIDSIPGAVNCYEIGLDNQLALIQQADVFLSPHTGFGFLAPALGTAWLTLSGGEWAEPMVGQTPFYSVLPSCSRYPCHSGGMLKECKLRLKFRQPVKCMARIVQKKDEIVFGLKKLLSEDYALQDAIDSYKISAEKNGNSLSRLARIPRSTNP